uniref:Uncharacterized protein n=1 Tax=Parascaris equorum TaxID=6256 RepID=A0A914RBD5_PAREQ
MDSVLDRLTRTSCKNNAWCQFTDGSYLSGALLFLHSESLPASKYFLRAIFGWNHQMTGALECMNIGIYSAIWYPVIVPLELFMGQMIY